MRTIVLTYPGYQSLPKGIKQLLVATENFYFDESGSAAGNRKAKDAKPVQFPSSAGFGNPFIAYAGS